MMFSDKKKFLRVLCLALAAVLALSGVFATLALHRDNVFSPEYPKVDLTAILEKAELDEADYKTLFYQTGLGKCAIDELKAAPSFEKTVLTFQENFFSSGKSTVCRREAITTCMEYSVDSSGEVVHPFTLAPHRAGDVVAMFSSHSFGWRHGHAGLVLSGEKTLEAPIIGLPSMRYSLASWREYPTFIMLRLKDATAKECESITADALARLEGVYYSPLAGFEKTKYASGTPTMVQCAYLVWNALYGGGYDVDSDGGRIVTVQDIVFSDKFEVVQIYGIDPDLFIDKIM